MTSCEYLDEQQQSIPRTGMNQEVEDELLVLEVRPGSAASDTADVVVVDLSGPVDAGCLG
jgi:hypothetical protein